MSKFASVLAVFFMSLLTAATVMAQDIPLPGPGGPNDRPPMPPPATAERPPVVTPPTTQPLDPFPGQRPPNYPGNPGQIGNAPSDTLISTMGQVLPGRAARDYVFYPTAGYDVFEQTGIVSLRGAVRINSIRMTFKDGRPPIWAVPEMTGVYRTGEGRIWLYIANNVESIIVNAQDARGDGSASFRVDSKSLRAKF